MTIRATDIPDDWPDELKNKIHLVIDEYNSNLRSAMVETLKVKDDIVFTFNEIMVLVPMIQQKNKLSLIKYIRDKLLREKEIHLSLRDAKLLVEHLLGDI